MIVLLSTVASACAQKVLIVKQDHGYTRADGSRFSKFAGRLVIHVPNWQRSFPYCEHAWTVGGYLEHGRCQAQESAQSFDIRSGEPVWEYEPPPQMSNRQLKRLLRWRNRFDRPFSMFVMGPDHSREAKYKYSIRLAFGHMLEPSKIFKIWRKNFVTTDDYIDNYSVKLETKAWAVRNLSEYAARDWDYFVAELFAWYTAPWYERGSLSSEVEEQLEKMANFDWPADWEDDYPSSWGRPALVNHPALDQMKAALAQARQAQPCNCYVDKPFMAHDELTFLYIWRWEHRFDAPWPTYDRYAVPFCKYPTSHPSYESSCKKDD